MVHTQTFTLNARNELQIFVGQNTAVVRVQLVDGFAEMFGAAMDKNLKYIFQADASIAIFTWRGCIIKVTGTSMQAYVATATPMTRYIRLHAILEEMRVVADAGNRRGPVVLLVGSTDTGKNNLCKILLNYAARTRRQPFFCDLDVGESDLSIPGTINVLNVAKPTHIVDGFDQDAIQTYQFGYENPGQLIALYFLLIKRIGKDLCTYISQSNRNVRSSGAIINTFGWTRGNGYKSITLAALSFNINVLVVLEKEDLYHQLRRDMPQSVRVIYIPIMSGIVNRSRFVHYQNRYKRVREYFYGSSHPLFPYTFLIKFEDVKIIKIKNADERQVSVNVPINKLSITKVEMGDHLIDQVLAISSANSMSYDLLLTNVLGFIKIVGIGVNGTFLKILSLQPEPLSNNILIMGDIELHE